MTRPKHRLRMPPPGWFDALRKFWVEEGFDPSGKTLLLAVSGGCDSTAMLELFDREVAPLAGCRLQVAHVDHGLREDSHADREFVQSICDAKNIPLHVEVLNPKTRAAGQSIEMWGRAQRYAAFAIIAKKCGADHILTAHHRNDVVETLCLRLWRGTGFAGLAGIPFRRGQVLRPLLPLAHAALQGWLTDQNLPWREDASNADTRIPRNWVRHRLLPAWRAQDAEVETRLFRIARDAARMLPSWELWLAALHPSTEIREHGGIPIAWLRQNGAAAEVLRRHLPALGVDRPAPEMLAEILRQADSAAARIRVRIGDHLILTDRNGVLVAVKAPFKRAKKPG